MGFYDRSNNNDFERAKLLYFINFGNHHNMDENGELKEYQRYHISSEQENIWSHELKDSFMNLILVQDDYLSVLNLSRLELPKDEIIAAFKTLAASSKADKIAKHMRVCAPLYDVIPFNELIELFPEQSITQSGDGSKPLKKSPD